MAKFKKLREFVLEIDFLTTKEFCEKYNIPLPTANEGVSGFLSIEVIKSKLYVEYAKFLNKELKLEMFIPCDKNGNPIENKQKEEYNNLKTKVLFKSNEINLPKTRRQFVSWVNYNGLKKVEDLIRFDIELTKDITDIINYPFFNK